MWAGLQTGFTAARDFIKGIFDALVDIVKKPVNLIIDIINGMIAGLDSGDISAVARRMHNVFESFLPRRYGEVHTIKGKLLDFGSLGAVMTGTGSAVFGVFDSEKKAKAAFEHLKGGYRDVFLSGPL